MTDWAEPTFTSPAQGDALLVLNLQRDLLPGGSLAVKGDDAVLAPINACIEQFAAHGLPVIAIRDWHPPDHVSFQTQGGPWPAHCVAGTPGADLAEVLALHPARLLVSKGTRPEKDAKSAFDGTDLHHRLLARYVRRLFIAGLAADDGVLASALDARALGYGVVLVRDAVAAIDLQAGDGDSALARMAAAGVLSVDSAALRPRGTINFGAVPGRAHRPASAGAQPPST